MAEERPQPTTGECYHIFNRGVEKRKIFLTDRDRNRFLLTLNYYLDAAVTRPLSAEESEECRALADLKQPLVEILAYCLMPNHFHLLLRQVADGGLRRYISQVQNSYTRYFNRRYERIGPLLQGRYHGVHVRSDEQLLHLSRYIHLNPYVSQLSKTLEYHWSSLKVYTQQQNKPPLCTPGLINNLMGEQSYKAFVDDFKEYALALETIKPITLD